MVKNQITQPLINEKINLIKDGPITLPKNPIFHDHILHRTFKHSNSTLVSPLPLTANLGSKTDAEKYQETISDMQNIIKNIEKFH